MLLSCGKIISQTSSDFKSHILLKLVFGSMISMFFNNNKNEEHVKKHIHVTFTDISHLEQGQEQDVKEGPVSQKKKKKEGPVKQSRYLRVQISTESFSSLHLCFRQRKLS